MPGSSAAELHPGSGGLRAAGPAGGRDASPSEFEDFLAAELARLGKDPSSTVSAAPKGSENAVFDLDAEIIDPDGEGGDPPTGIALTWTEQLIGDYDQNGLVNASDLTPLGQNWTAEIKYDDESLHGGFAYWPAGDPDDYKAGSGAVPGAVRIGGTKAAASGKIVAATGAANWRLARIDGNRDGQLYQYDITPIAVHWQERLSGYRVYVKAPDESGFAVVETVVPQRSGSDPVRLSYVLPVTDSGSYGVYVAPYDGASAIEGIASPALYIDVETGCINHAPVARLSVNPEFAGAPAEITLDASSSYDTDGGIAAYRWDFDGDGMVDWVSTNLVPESSSDGTVESITPGEDGVVIVTYMQGGANWIYPTVAVVDDQDVQSAPTEVKLGISGWTIELLADPFSSNIDFSVGAISHDPRTGQVCLAGFVAVNAVPPWAEEAAQGLYWARRIEPEQWDIEFVQSFTEPEILGDWDRVDWVTKTDILWDSNGNPILAAGYFKQFPWQFKYKTIIIKASDSGTWQKQDLLNDYVIRDVAVDEQGTFHFMLDYQTSNSSWQNHLGTYDGGGLVITETGYNSDTQGSLILNNLYIDESNNAHFGINDPDKSDLHSLYILDPTNEDTWTPLKLLSIEDGDYSSLVWKELLHEAGRITCLCIASSKVDPVFGYVDDLHIATVEGSSINTRLVRENVDLHARWLFALQDGYSVFAPDDSYNEETDEVAISYCQFTKALETRVIEEVARLDKRDYMNTTRIELKAAHCFPDGRAVAVHYLQGAEYGQGNYGVFLGYRVDPRM